MGSSSRQRIILSEKRMAVVGGICILEFTEGNSAVECSKQETSGKTA